MIDVIKGFIGGVGLSLGVMGAFSFIGAEFDDQQILILSGCGGVFFVCIGRLLRLSGLGGK